MWIRVAAVFGVVGVALGAFGAHALRARLAPEQLASWETAVHYQLFHSGASPWLFAVGMLLFSGSIYGLVLGAGRWLGPVTPLGGVALMAGWISLWFLARPH